MNNTIKYITIFTILFFSLSISLFAAENETVTVSGYASGTPSSARELALTNALREAVRKGAGVDILTESKVQNFTLEYDRVMTSSFGYIKSYKVISRKYNPTKKQYSVTIEAEVAKGKPKMDQILALRLLLKRMKSPRVMIECEENIAGISKDSNITQMLLEEMAQKTGFEVFKEKKIKERNKREALRAEILGDKLDAAVKKGNITSTSDFMITAKVTGEVGGLREPFPEMKVRDAALGIDLQAVWTDTGEVIATVALPTTYHKGESNMNLPYDMPAQLIRYYLNTSLSGKNPGSEKDSGYKLFRKIIAKWITELDLGAKIQLELKQINKADVDKLITGLENNSSISYVWLREFDSRLYSILEIESRLPIKDIEKIILKELKGKFSIDTATKRRLRFIPKK